jgi:hypothetical protein
MPVALRRPRRRSFVRRRANHFSGFGFDQRLQHELQAATHHIKITTRADRVEQLQQVRLGQDHRRGLLRVPG